MATSVKLSDVVPSRFAHLTQRSYEMAGAWPLDGAVIAEIRGVGVAQVQPSLCVGMWEVRLFADHALSVSKPMDREVVGLWLLGMGFDPDMTEWKPATIVRVGPQRSGVTKSDRNPTELYRCFDADGHLLYVGISLSAAQRLSQHRNCAGWWSDVSRIDLQRFPNRAAALAAEAHAIATEGPAHNG